MSSKEPGVLRIASVSDIHIGHTKTPASHIISNLYDAFPDNESTAKLDLICIVGDLFDRLLSYPDPGIHDFEVWANQFLRMCAKHKIKLRILEGTPSHDWKQSKVFLRINEDNKIACDLRYFDDITIETVHDWDQTFLYIPDEWGKSTEHALSHVQELMTAKGLSKVDYAFMHGQFPHQLPPVANKGNCHNTDAYLQLVDKLIFIGHVHQFSVFERIVAQGSFDRLTHGDEAAKGHVRATVKSRNNYKLTFVENKNAMVYKTLDCRALSLEDALKHIEEKVLNLPVWCYVRVHCNKADPIVESLSTLKDKWPRIHWDKKVDNGEGEKIESTVDVLESDDYVPIAIHPGNIEALVLERATLKGATPDQLEIVCQFFKEIK